MRYIQQMRTFEHAFSRVSCSVLLETARMIVYQIKILHLSRSYYHKVSVNLPIVKGHFSIENQNYSTYVLFTIIFKMLLYQVPWDYPSMGLPNTTEHSANYFPVRFVHETTFTLLVKSFWRFF